MVKAPQYCQAAAQMEVPQFSSSDSPGGKSCRKQFLETAQGVLSFALQRNDLQGVLLSRTGPASVSMCKQITANLNALMTLYHRQATHLFALPQKAKEKTNQTTTEYLIWGSKVRKQSVWKIIFGKETCIDYAGKPFTTAITNFKILVGIKSTGNF